MSNSTALVQKFCRGCKCQKALDQFFVDSSKNDGRAPRCKACKTAAHKAWVKKHAPEQREYRRGYNLAHKERHRVWSKQYYQDNKAHYKKLANEQRTRLGVDGVLDQRYKKYGLTAAQYGEMLRQQGGVCAICKQPETRTTKAGKVMRLCVDHDHETGKVRALLCDAHNRALGYLKDDFDTTLALAKYIQSHKGTV